jgi:hypothetical protein
MIWERVLVLFEDVSIHFFHKEIRVLDQRFVKAGSGKSFSRKRNRFFFYEKRAACEYDAALFI